MPPCTPWIEAEDVADCCDVQLGSLNQAALDQAADNASEILYELTGRRYTGTCERTVRPVGPDLGWCWGWHDLTRRKLSRVKLAGHVTAISEVLIDGDPVDPSLYRLDEHRYLTRMANPDGSFARWPNGQRLDLPVGEPNTFAVTYEHGLAPPGTGVAAAAALACELYKACPAAGDEPGECSLPDGVVRVIRQGVMIETVSAIASMLRRGSTGLIPVDAFLSVHGKRGRKPVIWSPDMDRFARPEGITSGS